MWLLRCRPWLTPSDVEARLSALEARVGELAERVQHSEQDAAAARVLAGGDVEQIRGEIRDFRQSTTASFNSMCEELTDLRARVEDGLAQVDRGFAEVRGQYPPRLLTFQHGPAGEVQGRELGKIDVAPDCNVGDVEFPDNTDCAGSAVLRVLTGSGLWWAEYVACTPQGGDAVF